MARAATKSPAKKKSATRKKAAPKAEPVQPEVVDAELVDPSEWVSVQSASTGPSVEVRSEILNNSDPRGRSAGPAQALEIPGKELETQEDPAKAAAIERHHLSKFTPEICDAIVTGVRSGLPPEHAASQAGISRRTYSRWAEKGEADPLGEYAEFIVRVEQAESEHMAELLEEWRQVGSQTKQWTSLATLAERRYADHFAKRNRTADKPATTNVQVNVIGQLERNLHEVHGKRATELDIYDGG